MRFRGARDCPVVDESTVETNYYEDHQMRVVHRTTQQPSRGNGVGGYAEPSGATFEGQPIR
jgi:hypothetical protein